METRSYALHRFEELTHNAQQKVLDRERYINVEDEWWAEPTLRELKAALEGMGYEDPHILYSGFASQGDGACFEARVDLVRWLKHRRLGQKYRRLLNAYLADEASIYIRHGGHYYHAYSTNVDSSYIGNDDQVERELVEVEALIETDKVDVSKQIYRALEDVYYGSISDEAVGDTLAANEHRFHADGCRAHE